MLKSIKKKVSSHPEENPNSEEKLQEFVTNFVCCYEKFLNEYDDRLENEKTKPGKWADLLKIGIAAGKDATETLSIVEKCITGVGNMHNRREVKKLLSQLEAFKKDPHAVRGVLVESGIEIFQSFATQFVQVQVNGSWKMAIKKLARDSVTRVLDYSRKSAGEKFSVSFVTKGVILGESKQYRHVSCGIPRFQRGRTVFSKNSTRWITGKLFRNAGLVTAAGKFYKRTDGKSSKYGYRLLFAWESEDRLRDYYQEDKTAAGKDFAHPLRADVKESLKQEIMSGINNFKLTTGNEDFSNFQQEINQHFVDLDDFLTDNFNSIKELMIGHHEELSNKVDEAKKEIIQAIKRPKHRAEIKRPYMFDVRESVPSFTGREEKLKEIAEHHKNQAVVVISGLAGVGKTELAVKYARDRFRAGSSVIWINAETQETSKDSYKSLLKEIGRKTLDRDKEEMSLRHMAKTVHNLFSHSLFIFDSAEEYSLMEILPRDSQVLITSQNSQILSQEPCGKVELNLLSENEAVDFVKTALGIKNSQDKDVNELVNAVERLPLALQLAVSFIKESDYAYKIGKYVNLFTKSEEEIQSFLNQKSSIPYDKTILMTFKATIDRVTKEGHGELAEEILHFIAYFSPDNIPEEAFLNIAFDAVKESNTKLKKEKAEKDLKTTTNIIAKYSVISRKDEREFSLHRLVQKVIRTELRKLNCEEEVLRKALELLKEFVNENKENAGNCVPHIMSIWNYACYYENLVKTFIVDRSQNKATTSTPHFMLIVEGCSFKAIETIISKIDPADLKKIVNIKNKYRSTPLHKAVFRTDEEGIVKLLLAVGADVNTKQGNEWTPLHLAAKNGNLSVVKTLLEHNADVDEVTQAEFQFTPLHLAAQNGHNEIVEALLVKGANANAKTTRNRTPLQLAAHSGHFDVVQVLLNSNLENADFQIKKALYLGAKMGHVDVVKVLVAEIADINAQNQHGFTALHFAAMEGHDDVVSELLKVRDIDVDVKTSQGKTAQDLATEKEHHSIVRALKRFQAKTALYLAILS